MIRTIGAYTTARMSGTYNPGQEEDDVLDQKLSAVHYDGLPVPPDLQKEPWAAIVSDAIFGGDAPPLLPPPAPPPPPRPPPPPASFGRHTVLPSCCAPQT